MVTQRDETIGQESDRENCQCSRQQLHSAGRGKLVCRTVHWPRSKTELSRFHISSSTQTFETYLQNRNRHPLYQLLEKAKFSESAPVPSF